MSKRGGMTNCRVRQRDLDKYKQALVECGVGALPVWACVGAAAQMLYNAATKDPTATRRELMQVWSDDRSDDTASRN